MNDRIISYIRYHPVRTQRGLEILSGLMPWLIIIFPFIGSFFAPDIVAYFVLAFNVYWLYRSLQLVIFAISGYLNIRATEKTDWLVELKSDLKTRQSFSKIHHLVIMVSVSEPLSILERNLEAISEQSFPRKNITVVLAMENRIQDAHQRANFLIRKYKGKLGQIFVTYHQLAAGETMGKHSNEAYAAKEAKRILVDNKKIPIDRVIVTVVDADTVLPSQYLALLGYKFLKAPDKFHKFFQAPLFAYNNIHRVPFLVRLPAIISGIGTMASLQRLSRRYVISANYSLSLRLLHAVDYWDLDYIPEDWHLYFKAYFKTGGKAEIVPMFIPVLIDAAESTTRLKTYKNAYEQNKRWAWGVVDVPYVVKNFFLHPEIPLFEKIIKVSAVLEQHFIWSSYWFLITLGATIPTVLNPVFARTALGFNLSRMSSFILTLCLVGIFTIIVIDTLLNPRKKNKLLTLLHPFTYLQWVVIPVTGFLFGVLPGLESQTRLMLGKYLEYRVTEKV